MYIYSEKTKQRYDTVDECLNAEKAWEEERAAEQERKQKLADERKTRAKEVEDAFKTAYELLEAFTKDYNSFHFTIRADSPFKNFMNWLW